MINILIVGGNSFIAQNLIGEYSDSDKYNIDILVRNKVINFNTLQSNIRYHVFDYYTDLGVLIDLVKSKKIDNIYYFTSSLKPRELNSQIEVSNFLRDIELLGKIINITTQYKVKKFTYFSSAGAVYGKNNSKPYDENSLCFPDTLYGDLKLISEKLIIKHFSNTITNYLILRPTNVYGPLHISSDVGIINIFIRRMLSNKNIEIFGDGNQIRNFIYVKDVVKFTKKLFQNNINNQIINISSNINKSVVEIRDIINEFQSNYIDVLNINFDYTKQENINNIIYNNDKLTNIIGPIKFTNFFESLKETYVYETKYKL